jgi:formamidopyrimidine-DNA glycosylase
MVLPGVGNIIKQESLHRAGMNPLRKVGDFSEDEIARLVDILRWFSMEWLKVRMRGGAKRPARAATILTHPRFE